jgi:uncharacterized membrane protein YcaP (DUF421 family)
LLLITLLADASQNGMAGNYRSLPEGMALVLTIIFWDYALDWLAFKSPFLRKLLEASKLTLVHNGDLADVKRATMESNGRISVIKRESAKA